jgi:dTDP-4-amino-4,6-dideoxygalactose transaminase
VIPLFKTAVAPSAAARVAEVITSGYLGQGPRVTEFETALAAWIGNPRVATVNSATSGLHLALHMLAGGRSASEPAEVLTTPLTFPATNWPILANGLTPRWVDVDPATLNLDLDDLARKISARTRLIIVVHWGGYPVDLDRVRAIQDAAEAAHGCRPLVIEDCAHAWGSTYHGRPLGNHGNVAIFSFQAIKHLTTADGGAIVLPDDALYRRTRLLRWLGLDRDQGERFRSELDVAEFGFKFHMNDVAAAIGLANLEVVGDLVKRHQQNALEYDRALRGVPGVTLTERAADRTSSCWLYTILVERRGDFIRSMTEAGISVSPVQRRNDHHTCVSEYRTPLPGLDRIADRIIAIPVGWWLGDEDRALIIQTIKAGW